MTAAPAYKAVLFDVDGTIAMTEPRNRKVIEDLAAAHGGEVKKSDWDFLAGQPEKDIWGWLKEQFPALSIEKQDFVDQCRSGYLKSEFNIVARPGMKEAIEYFKSKGLRLIAVSNSPRNLIEHSLRAVGCIDDMEFIISAAEDVPNPKPAPDGFLLGVDMLAQTDPSINVGNCIIFEDSGTGVRSGYASGCFVAQLLDEGSKEHEKASAHIRNAQELQALCQKLVP